MISTTDAGTSRWQRLAYRGPSIDRLYDSYARERQIDPAAPISARHEVDISAPVERVWAVLAAPEGWPAVDPTISHVELGGEVVEGTRFRWRKGSTRLSSRFAVVDPHHELTWVGEGLGARVVHRHVLTPAGGGRTRLCTEESMSGPLVGLVFSSARLHDALERWAEAIARAAEA